MSREPSAADLRRIGLADDVVTGVDSDAMPVRRGAGDFADMIAGLETVGRKDLAAHYSKLLPSKS